MARMGLARAHSDSGDPLAWAFAPPQNETPAEKIARLLAEKQAKIISDQIDEDLIKQKAQEKKSPRALRVLLLGKFQLCWVLLVVADTMSFVASRSKRIW